MNLYIPTINPSPEIPRILSEAITKSFTLSIESWTTDRKAVNTGKEIHLDIGSSSNIFAPLFLLPAHEKKQRIDPASATNPPARVTNNRFKDVTFDKVKFEQYVVKSDGIRQPKDLIMTNYPPILTYDKKNIYYSLQVIGLKFQMDYVTPKKINSFEENDEDPIDTSLYAIVKKCRENIMVFDGKKISGVEFI